MRNLYFLTFALVFLASCSGDADESIISGISISDNELTLVKGEHYTLVADAVTVDGDKYEIRWATSDGNIVTVDSRGNLVAGEVGNAEVYAIADTKQAVCNVTVTLPAPASVGDYYYSDGTYSSELNASKECIGIVFHVGQHENDRSDYSDSGIGEEKCHGYVVALRDAHAELCLWGVYGYELGFYPVDQNGAKIDNFSNNGGDTDWSGYDYTDRLFFEAERNGGLAPDTQEGYPVGYYTRKFADEVPAPSNSSGWFIPAISQLYTIYSMSDRLNAYEGMDRLRNRWYWSSSECFSLADGSINCLDVNIGAVGYRGKFDQIGLIRPILAF